MPAHKMTLDDWLDDLCVRFIINLPQADLASMARICFQVEEAHWFYDDFIRPLDNTLPSMNLRTFCLTIFKRCPLLAPFPIENHIRAFEEFLKYKTSIPVRGAILLNEAMDMALLVKGWKKGAHWSFPKGKINMDEDDLDCAVREVDEETGFDIRAAGLVPPPEDVKFIETMFRDQQIRLYVFRDVPMDTHFEPKTRKEIGGIQWYRIADLPTFRKKTAAAGGSGHHQAGHETDDPVNQPASKFYMVAPFMGPLKKWVAIQRKKDAIRAGHEHLAPQLSTAEDPYTEDETALQPEPEPHHPYHYQNHSSRTPADPEQMMANASRELQQMLNMQPHQSQQQPQLPSSQAPVPAANAGGYVDSNQSKASALLAVLQQGGNASQGSRAAAPPAGYAAAAGPHTPLDQTYGQAPQPTTPYHHHYPSQQPSYAQQPPPPPHQQQQGPPPPYHQQMPQASQHPQDQPLPEFNQYGEPRPDLQYQPNQQNQHQHQHQHRQPRHYQGEPSQTFQGQTPNGQSMQGGREANPFAPLPQAQQHPHPHYATQTHAAAAAAAYHYQQQQQQQPAAPPIPLLHPQPLPPTVQKALFTRESLASPDMTAAAGGRGGEANASYAAGYAAGRQGGLMAMMAPPPQQQQPQGQPAPLSSHAASLLSVFKKTDNSSNVRQGEEEQRPGVGAGAPGWPQQASPQQPQQPRQQPQQQPQQQSPQQHEMQQLHGPRPQPSASQQYGATYSGAGAGPYAGQGLPDAISSIINNSHKNANRSFSDGDGNDSGNPFAAHATAPSAQSSQHISALLSMFKQTAPSSSSSPQVPELAAAAAPAGPVASAPRLHGGNSSGARAAYSATTLAASPTPGQGQSQAQAIEAAARANGGPVEMHSDLSLPFGALSILTRPKGQPDADRSSLRLPSTYSGTPIAELAAGNAAPRKQPQPPQQQQPQQPPQHQPAQYQQQTAQYQQLLLAAAEGRQDPEHKQKLLSLFSKQQQQAPQLKQMSPTGAVPGAAGGGMQAPPPPGSASSRSSVEYRPPVAAAAVPFGVGLAEGGGGGGGVGPGPSPLAGAPRRGSQTPISPADRNFLLGYLANMSRN